MQSAKSFAIGAALCGLLMGGSPSLLEAATIPFNDAVSGPVVLTSDAGYAYQHNVADTLDLSIDTIETALLTILVGDQGGAEIVAVQFNGGAFSDFANNVPNPGASLNFDLANLSGNLVASLQVDGLLDVALRVRPPGNQTSADAVFISSVLTGFASRPTTGATVVPEPGTMSLVAIGAIGACFLRRRARGTTNLTSPAMETHRKRRAASRNR
jgi:hypothetical protein